MYSSDGFVAFLGARLHCMQPTVFLNAVQKHTQENASIHHKCIYMLCIEINKIIIMAKKITLGLRCKQAIRGRFPNGDNNSLCLDNACKNRTEGKKSFASILCFFQVLGFGCTDWPANDDTTAAHLSVHSKEDCEQAWEFESKRDTACDKVNFFRFSSTVYTIFLWSWPFPNLLWLLY